MKYGFLTLGDITPDPVTDITSTAKQRLEEILDAAIVLAAIAMRTERIRLRTGVPLMPNLDPVPVAEDYATVDLLSGGRLEAEIAKRPSNV